MFFFSRGRRHTSSINVLGVQTFALPILVVQMPYDLAPLTALMLFETDEPMHVSFEVATQLEGGTLSYTFEAYETSHRVPIYGLYAATTNDVVVTMVSTNGKTHTHTVQLVTDAVPEDMMTVDLKVKDPKNISEGMNFVASTYVAAIDLQGDLR